MTQFNTLSQTVLNAIDTGQIGTPVAARLIVHATADHGLLERLAARALQATGEWLAERPLRMTAFGGVDRGQLGILVLFQKGQSALVSAGTSGIGVPRLEAVVWGSRGTLAWHDSCAPLAISPDEGNAGLSQGGRRWLQHLREAIQSGDTVELRSGAAAARRQTTARSSATRRASSGFLEEQRRRQLKPQKPPYGVLLVSGDHTHQPAYAGALAADERCRLIGLVDETDVSPRRKRLNEQFAQRMNIPVLPDLKQALHRDDVHIVSICAEPARRGPIIVEAARTGKHLYLDKPLAGSLAHADQVRAAVDEAGVVGHMWSLVRTANMGRVRRAVESAALGDVGAVHFDLCFAKGQAGTAELGQPRRETLHPGKYELIDSKRELSNVGVYALVGLLWLLDKPVRRVAATTGNYFFAEHQKNDMEDFGQMLLELDGGQLASASVGRTGWHTHRGGGLNRVYVAGSKQAALFDSSLPRAELWADVEPWSAPPRDPADPMGMWGGPKEARYRREPKQDWITPADSPQTSDVEYFLDCIEAGRPSDVSARLAASATEILLAGYRSAADGESVALPLPRDTG